MGIPLIKPPALRQGDTIGIAAPASPFDRDHFDRGIAVIESLGYGVKVPAGCFNRKGYLAGTDAERAELLRDLFDDGSVRAVLCARGGFGSLKLLPLLDFSLFAARPKVLVGFSDITALLLAIYHRSGMVTFHGPLVTTLREATPETQEGLTRAIGRDEPLTLRPARPVVLRPGTVSGRMIGGNLTVLCHLIGTPYEPDFHGHILFLEDQGEDPYRIERMMTHLKLSGRLDGIAGLLLGSFQDCGPSESIHAIAKEALSHREVPILAGFGIGHGTDNLTVPIGVEVTMETETASAKTLEPAVSVGYE